MKTNPTAKKMKELRAAGCKIKVTHYRIVLYGGGQRLRANPSMPSEERMEIKSVREFDEEKARRKEAGFVGLEVGRISPNGGRVEVEIETPDGKKFNAVSECSLLDNFQRKIGTAIAFGRAVKQMDLSGKAADVGG